MSDYFEITSKELLLRLGQVKEFIQRHNPTIGIVTEEILRGFLKEHLPKFVSVEQGFIKNKKGEISKQCDIIIYDSTLYAPFYRINDIVVVPEEAVILFIEVKTTINKAIFHDTLTYFISQRELAYKPAFLFIYNSEKIESVSRYFHSYKIKGREEYTYDHDTFPLLPDEITGINSSYHLKQDLVVGDSDTNGYSSYSFINEEGTEINALQHFYLSVYGKVEEYINKVLKSPLSTKREDYFKKKFSSYRAFSLFNI